MLSAYPACFFKESTGYSVVFPDLNDLSTCGDTLEEALSMAIDCLAGYLYDAQIDHEEVPAASSIASISVNDVASSVYDGDAEYSEAFVNIVTVDVDEYARLHFTKSVKKTLSIPAWMNDKAVAMGINFSQTLQEALLQKFA